MVSSATYDLNELRHITHNTCPLGCCGSEMADSGISANGDVLPALHLKRAKEKVKLAAANASQCLKKKKKKQLQAGVDLWWEGNSLFCI